MTGRADVYDLDLHMADIEAVLDAPIDASCLRDDELQFQNMVRAQCAWQSELLDQEVLEGLTAPYLEENLVENYTHLEDNLFLEADASCSTSSDSVDVDVPSEKERIVGLNDEDVDEIGAFGQLTGRGGGGASSRVFAGAARSSRREMSFASPDHASNVFRTTSASDEGYLVRDGARKARPWLVREFIALVYLHNLELAHYLRKHAESGDAECGDHFKNPFYRHYHDVVLPALGRSSCVGNRAGTIKVGSSSDGSADVSVVSEKIVSHWARADHHSTAPVAAATAAVASIHVDQRRTAAATLIAALQAMSRHNDAGGAEKVAGSAAQAGDPAPSASASPLLESRQLLEETRANREREAAYFDQLFHRRFEVAQLYAISDEDVADCGTSAFLQAANSGDAEQQQLRKRKHRLSQVYRQRRLQGDVTRIGEVAGIEDVVFDEIWLSYVLYQVKKVAEKTTPSDRNAVSNVILDTLNGLLLKLKPGSICARNFKHD